MAAMRIDTALFHPGPLFTKRTDVLPQELVKYPSREIRAYTFPIGLKFDRYLDSNAFEMPDKFESDMIIIAANLAATRLHEIWR